MRKNRQREIGFTIVELLATITIISVLSALLLPVLGNAREKGREISCLNNLKQIGIAVELYTQDCDGWTPPLYDDSGNGGIYVTLNEYLKNANVFWCPSSGDNRKWNGQSAPISTKGVSYGFNFYGTGTIAPNRYSGFFSTYETWEPGYNNVKRVKVPEQLIVAADTFYDLDWECSIGYNPIPLIFGPGNIHHGGSNVLFGDGHVSWHSVDYLRNTIYIWNQDNSNTDYFGG